MRENEISTMAEKINAALRHAEPSRLSTGPLHCEWMESHGGPAWHHTIRSVESSMRR